MNKTVGLCERGRDWKAHVFPKTSGQLHEVRLWRERATQLLNGALRLDRHLHGVDILQNNVTAVLEKTLPSWWPAQRWTWRFSATDGGSW